MTAWSDPAVILGIIGTSVTAIGGVIWAVRLEGAQEAHEEVDKQREAWSNERHTDVKDRLEAIENTMKALDRIERTLNHISERV